MDEKKKRFLESIGQKRTATFAAEVREAGEGTVELSFSSELPVWRWGGDEILVHEAGAADFSRLEEVGAILLNHDPRQIVGAPVRVWLDEKDRKGRLTMRFGTTPEAEKARKEVVEDKTLRGVSVGYIVDEGRWLDDGESYGRFTGPCFIATKWQAYEASLTPVPADPSVGVGRSLDNQTPTKDTNMNENGTTPTPAATPAAAPAAPVTAPAEVRTETPAAPAAAREDAAKAERQRCADIAAVCNKRGIDPAPYIASDKDLTTVYRELLDLEPAGQQPLAVEVTTDGRDSFREAAVEALQLRLGVVREAKHGGDEMRGWTLMEMARECLRRANLPTKGRPTEVAERALKGGWRKEDITAGTSDFPVLMAATVLDTLEKEYREVPTNFREWCAIGSVTDFREAKRIEISDIGELDQIPEFGNYKSAAFADRQEKVSILTYGKIFGLSRQMVINDVLEAFATVPRAFARSAARLPQTLAVKKLLQNPVLNRDSVAVFATAHGNLLTGAGNALDTVAHAAAGIRAARALMLKHRAWTVTGQKDDNGKPIAGNDGAYLSILPRILLVNADDEFNAGTVISSAAAVDGSNSGVTNPIRNWGLRIVVEQNIANTAWGGTANNWFMFADPNDAPVVQVNFLNGNDAPYMEEADQTNVDGRYWKIRLDVGADAIGCIGAVKATGAAE